MDITVNMDNKIRHSNSNSFNYKPDITVNSNCLVTLRMVDYMYEIIICRDFKHHGPSRKIFPTHFKPNGHTKVVLWTL